MLRVRIELIPGGDEAASRLLGELEICNDGTGTEFTGNYDVALKEYSVSATGESTAVLTRAIIEGVERDIARPVQLVGLAMSVLAPVKRTMSNTLTPLGRIVSQEVLGD